MIGRHKFFVGKNFEVENIKLLTMIFSENILSVEMGLKGHSLLIRSYRDERHGGDKFY
jgi:hypothetical protein